jgi:arylsulfatase A-like enzyme
MWRRIQLFWFVASKLISRFILAFATAALVIDAFQCVLRLDSLLLYRTVWEIVASASGILLLTLVLAVGAGVIAGLAAAAVLVGFTWPGGVRTGIRRATNIVATVSTLLIAYSMVRNSVEWLPVVAEWHLGRTEKSLLKLGLLVSAGAFLLARRRLFVSKVDRFFRTDGGRRNVLAFCGSAAAVSVADVFVRARAVGLETRPAKSLPNILLVTFDALSAEDMSVYGYHLPTTPNIDRFAQTATLFENFYATSTFTTPAITSMICGRYPSETGVFQLFGRLRGEESVRTLPNVLRKAGYQTAASVANPAAHPDAIDIQGYDISPPCPIEDRIAEAVQSGHLNPYVMYDWKQVDIFSPKLKFFAVRTEEALMDAVAVGASAIPPEASFTQAKTLWRGMSGPKFLHVHVFAPHAPYQPSRAFLGRFLPEDQLAIYSRMGWIDFLKPNNLYDLEYQKFFDTLRLRYNEWIANADAAFGAFLETMDGSGALANTIIAVSADHGESFQGGFYGHGFGYQHRPVIRIPMMIRRPGQTQLARIVSAHDGVSLAPTLLDLAGLPVPDWMDGRSLKPLLEEPDQNSPSMAFTQYLENNSTFAPVSRGTVGVIDSHYQYIVDLESRKGALYELAQAHLHTNELSTQRPEIASAMREHIRARFPNIAILA